RCLTHDDQVAAADAVFAQGGGRFANKLAVHHGYAPIMLAGEALRYLPPVAEVTQCVAELQALVPVKAGVARRPGACEHALAGPCLEPLFDLARSRRRQRA